MIYSRLFYGIVFLFLVYWVLPSILQTSTAANTPADVPEGFWAGIWFFLLRSFSLIAIYLQFPFTLLPFIFVVSPFISLILLYFRLRKEPGKTMREKFQKLNYNFRQSPKELISQSLRSKDWKKEIEMFKAFIILLPISLYLLTVILDIAHLDPVNIDQSETALGWFIEILFVYIATFLFGYQLFKSSKISLNGQFIGDQVKTKFFSSLTQIGTPIAILSTLLFIAQKTESITLIIYFFAYFLMAAYIFITLLRLFEPFSILIFFKIVDRVKRVEKIKSKNKSKVFMAIVYGLLTSVIGITVFMVFSVLLTNMAKSIPNGTDYASLSFITANPSFKIIELSDKLTLFNSLNTILIVLILACGLLLVLRQNLNSFSALLSFVGVLLVISILTGFIPSLQVNLPLIFKGDEYWLNSAPIHLKLFGVDFYTMRTAFLTAKFEDNIFLNILALIFNYTRPIANFLFWGYVFYFVNRSFFNKRVVHNGERNVIENISYSKLGNSTISPDLLENDNLLLMQDSNVNFEKLDPELRDVFSTIPSKKGITMGELKMLQTIDKDKLHHNVGKLTLNKAISWWLPEFSYSFEQAKLDGLYILYADGRDLIYYNFHKDQKAPVDPALVSGMFSAITAFIQETTHSSERLATIDHGDRKVILEYSEKLPVFGAIFADRATSDVRQALKDVLLQFTELHKAVLANWSGDMSHFDGDVEIIEHRFSDFI
ncbi:MAG: hypothetical protein ACTSWL_05370 [Promethearchaeota archaeon]